MKRKVLQIVGIIGVIVCLAFLVFGLNGCAKAETVNYNIRRDADNFKVRRH